MLRLRERLRFVVHLISPALSPEGIIGGLESRQGLKGALAVNSGDNQTPLTMTLQFETGGPEEVQGSISMDVIKFEIIVRLTLRFHQPTAAVDLFGWVDDINGITYTPQSSGPTDDVHGRRHVPRAARERADHRPG
jgi:hypothetical protein